MDCLDHNIVVAFAEGRLDESARAPVEEHLDRCPDCRDVAAELGRLEAELPLLDAGDDPTTPTKHTARASWTRARRWIGAYEVDERLGEGGMGVVYRARRQDEVGELALKCVLAADCDVATRRRFAREASAVRELDHPNVVRVLDWGETEEGMLLLAMELLDGEDLAARLRLGPLDPISAARIVAAAADGVGAAHEMGIAHRDLKPANLFLCADGRVKVLDFGLAVPFGQGTARFTGRSAIVGTPSFMAAEQARGAGKEDPRTDVWGLGATLYFAVAGRAPFAARSAMAQLVRIVTDPPDPLPGDVPEWLAKVVYRCLEKKPDDRFATMGELAGALRQGVGSGRTAPLAPRVTTLSEEIRLVAVLYAEEVRDLAAFAAAVEHHAGVAAPLLGDRAVGVFGGDVWLGDEPMRAVRAGLDARKSDAARWLGVATARSVRGRVGASAEEVVGSAREVAATEGVGADAEVLRRVRGGFDVALGRVVAVRRGQRPLGSAHYEGGDAPLFGRERERALIGADLRAAFAAPRASGVLVVGAPGIGKTRLCEAVEWDAIDIEGATPILRLEARGDASRALEPWHVMSAALRATLEDDGPEPAAQLCALQALGLRPSVAARLADVLGLPHGGPTRADEEPQDVFDAIVAAFGEWLSVLTARGPVLLAVEDADRADRASLRAIARAMRRLEHRPFFVVVAARDDLDGALRDFVRVDLDSLPVPATRALIETLVGPGDPRVDDLIERSAGNPLFAEELALSARDGVSEMPTSVEAAVQARLDGLPRAERNLLRRAAAVGTHFWVEALEAVGQADPKLLLASVRRLDVVVPVAVSRLPETREWRFRHALLRDVVYGWLTAEQRQTLHDSIGRWLAGRPEAPAAEVAAHLGNGTTPAAAAPWWSRAATSALRRGDAAVALEASGRALAHEIDPERLFELRLVRVDAMHLQGARDGMPGELEALARAARTTQERAAASLRRSRALRTQGHAVEAAVAAREGLEVAPQDVPLLAEAALALLESGRLEEGAKMAEGACELARRDPDEPFRLGRALNALGMCHYRRGEIGAALEAFEEALGAQKRAGHARHVAGTLGRVGYCLLAVGSPDEAVAVLEQSRKLAQDAGLRIAEAYALHNLGLAVARGGDAAEGLRLEEEALRLAHALRALPLVRDCGRAKALLLYEAGAIEEAERALADSMQSTPTAELETLRAMLLVARGRREEARTHVEAALALREDAGIGELEAELFVAAHEVGVPDALVRGLVVLEARAEGIRDPERRRRFLERVPGNARLRAVAGGRP